MSYPIVSTDQTSLVDRADFVASMHTWWLNARIVDESANAARSHVTDATAHLHREDETPFRIRHRTDGTAISTDGTRDQALEVAEWATRFGDDLLLVDIATEVCARLRPA